MSKDLLERMSYEYNMVQIASDLTVSANARQGNEAADYMQQVVNEEAIDEWEFYRVDSISVEVQPGCIASLIGLKSTYYNYRVITFRRKRTDNELVQDSNDNSLQRTNESKKSLSSSESRIPKTNGDESDTSTIGIEQDWSNSSTSNEARYF
jgi:hypothetical protein